MNKLIVNNYQNIFCGKPQDSSKLTNSNIYLQYSMHGGYGLNPSNKIEDFLVNNDSILCKLVNLPDHKSVQVNVQKSIPVDLPADISIQQQKDNSKLDNNDLAQQTLEKYLSPSKIQKKPKKGQQIQTEKIQKEVIYTNKELNNQQQQLLKTKNIKKKKQKAQTTEAGQKAILEEQNFAKIIPKESIQTQIKTKQQKQNQPIKPQMQTEQIVKKVKVELTPVNKKITQMPKQNDNKKEIEQHQEKIIATPQNVKEQNKAINNSKQIPEKNGQKKKVKKIIVKKRIIEKNQISQNLKEIIKEEKHIAQEKKEKTEQSKLAGQTDIDLEQLKQEEKEQNKITTAKELEKPKENKKQKVQELKEPQDQIEMKALSSASEFIEELNDVFEKTKRKKSLAKEQQVIEDKKKSIIEIQQSIRKKSEKPPIMTKEKEEINLKKEAEEQKENLQLSKLLRKYSVMSSQSEKSNEEFPEPSPKKGKQVKNLFSKKIKKIE